MIQTIQQTTETNNGPVYRATYHPSPEYYNGQNSASTGAVPRSWHTGSSDSTKLTSRPFQTSEEHQSNSQTVSVQIENKEMSQKEQNKNTKSMSKTYHTIRDMISSKFKSNKDTNEEKTEEPGLNNVTEELRKSQGNIAEEQDKKASGEQGIYGKPRIDQTLTHQQHQYNQHFVQQHLLAQQAQQQFQVTQQLKAQQQYSQQLVQARSQEMLAQDDQMYYHNYGIAPQRPPISRFVQAQQRDQTYVQMQCHQQVKHIDLCIKQIFILILTVS